MAWKRWLDRLDRLRRTLTRTRPLPLWHHEAFRLPVQEIHEVTGIEPRRADLALWALLGTGHRHLLEIHEPTRVSYGELGLVHSQAYLESLTRPRTLSAVFGLDADVFPVDAVLLTFRLGTGATIAAARVALERGASTVNLLGGFHHAFPDKGGGLCPVNDIAVALAVVRAEGFTGCCVVLDLDAHPPDGTAACLAGDGQTWIGSISGSDWGPLPGVDETFLEGADDATYLAALAALLQRLPRPDLAFVLAGGDVLADDRMGTLALTLDGARRRDEMVARWLGDRPAVWVPAGGYQQEAWRVLAGTVGVLLGSHARPIPPDIDPVASHFAYLSRGLDTRALRGTEGEHDEWFTQEDADAMFGAPSRRDDRLLGYYTEEGVEYVLWAFGFLTQLRRLGYSRFQVEIERAPEGDRTRLWGQGEGQRHLLWEMMVSIEALDGHPLLYLNWLSLRHPLGSFPDGRPRLPGQDAPGLGLAEEAMQLLVRMADRLSLEGILLRPAWYHTAYMGRQRFRFLNPDMQATFVAIQRDLGHIPLHVLSQAIAEGRVLDGGEPFAWQAEPTVLWIHPPDTPPDIDEMAATHHFTMSPVALRPRALPSPPATPG